MTVYVTVLHEELAANLARNCTDDAVDQTGIIQNYLGFVKMVESE